MLFFTALELVSSRNIEELVLVLRKEVAKTHNVVEHEDTGKYRQLLVRTLHACCIKVSSDKVNWLYETWIVEPYFSFLMLLLQSYQFWLNSSLIPMNLLLRMSWCLFVRLYRSLNIYVLSLLRYSFITIHKFDFHRLIYKYFISFLMFVTASTWCFPYHQIM